MQKVYQENVIFLFSKNFNKLDLSDDENGKLATMGIRQPNESGKYEKIESLVHLHT